MNFDHLNKIVPGWTHVDWDADRKIDDGEILIEDATGERFAVDSAKIQADPSVFSEEHVISTELMSAATWQEVETHLSKTGSQGVIYQKQDGSWTCRAVSSLGGSEIKWKYVKTCVAIAAGISAKGVFPLERKYGAASESEFTPRTVFQEWSLTLRSLGTGMSVGALWRPGQLNLSSPAPDLRGNDAFSFQEVIGTIDDEYFQYENPMSETYLSYQTQHGGIPGLVMSKARSDLEILAGGILGRYETREDLDRDVIKAGYGSYVSFRMPTGEWAFRAIRVKNANGELRNVEYLSEEDMERISHNLNLAYSRGCSEKLSDVTFVPACEVDAALLSRNEGLAELNLMLGENYAEALKTYLETISDLRGRENILNMVLKSERPDIEIQDLLAKSLKMHTQIAYPPTGRPNGKKVYFFNAANIKVSSVMRNVFELDAEGLIEDDVDRLRSAGFEVVVVECASSKDLLEAMYADSTAGIVWFGHSGPGSLASSHGFGINLIRDVDWERVSPSLKGFQILGCQFTKTWESVEDEECSEKSIKEYFPEDVYVTGYDRYMMSFDLPVEKTVAGGIAKTVGEIIARTPKPAEIETACVDEDGFETESETVEWTEGSEEYCEE